MFSVIIPAHNEEVVIAATLENMVAGARPDEFELIVVANGCTDNTAEIARRAGSLVQVHEIATASKIAALNAGDEIARYYPRIYADADVLISAKGLRILAERLRDGDVLAVAPTPMVDTSGCSWSVRAFYKIHALLPASEEGIGGSGVYAVSERGRGRFNNFPPVIADDCFVRIQFSPGERETLPSVTSTVFAPKRLRQLISIKTRSHLGNVELSTKYSELWKNKGPANKMLRLWTDRRLWPALVVYSWVKIEVRCRAKAQLVQLRAGTFAWARDHSSRQRSPV